MYIDNGVDLYTDHLVYGVETWTMTQQQREVGFTHDNRRSASYATLTSTCTVVVELASFSLLMIN